MSESKLPTPEDEDQGEDSPTKGSLLVERWIEGKQPQDQVKFSDLFELLRQFTSLEVHSSQTIVGPLPSASEMRGYNDISPKLVEDILNRANKEQDHRHAMDRYQVETDREALKLSVRVTHVGQLAGLILGLSAMGLSYSAFSVGMNGAGIAMMLGGVGTLAWAYLKHYRPNANAAEPKTEIDQK